MQRRVECLLMSLSVITGSGCGEPIDRGTRDEPARFSTNTAAVCEPGARRAAMPGEEGNECVCIESGFWDCYGVTPDRQIGGDAVCGSQLPLDRDECGWTFSECSDARTYTVRCFSRACVCIVDDAIVGELEHGLICIASVDEANQHCGWSLEVTR